MKTTLVLCRSKILTQKYVKILFIIICLFWQLNIDVSASWRGHEDVRTAFDMGYDEKIIASALITNDFSTFETLDEMIDRIESLRPYLEK